jgi:hypothetical protein
MDVPLVRMMVLSIPAPISFTSCRMVTLPPREKSPSGICTVPPPMANIRSAAAWISAAEPLLAITSEMTYGVTVVEFPVAGVSVVEFPVAGVSVVEFPVDGATVVELPVDGSSGEEFSVTRVVSGGLVVKGGVVTLLLVIGVREGPLYDGVCEGVHPEIKRSSSPQIIIRVLYFTR